MRKKKNIEYRQAVQIIKEKVSNEKISVSKFCENHGFNRNYVYLILKEDTIEEYPKLVKEILSVYFPNVEHEIKHFYHFGK